MLVLVLTACGGNSADSKNSQTNSNAPEETGVKELSFEVMIPKFGIDPAETLVQQQWQKEMEEYLGVKLNIKWNRIQWGSEYFEKAKVILASGEVPDIMLVLGNNEINDYGAKGLFVDIAPYVEQYPNYKSFVQETPSFEQYLYTADKKLFAFYDGYNNPTGLQPSQYNPAYRLDTFEQHDIKIPETMDEFYTAAKTLKELYPALYPVGTSQQYLAYDGFFNAYHTSSGIYWNGEEFVFGPTEQNFKEALQFIHKLYAEKLLDPAFVTDEIDQARPKATTGKTFMYPAIWSGFVTEFNDNAQANVKWTNALFPATQYGKGWQHSAEPLGKGLGNGSGIVISAKAQNPELLAKLVDYQYSDKMITLMNWGVEGQTYEIKDGNKYLSDHITDADNIYDEMCKYGVGTTGSCRAGIVWSPQDKEAKYNDPGSITMFYHNGSAEEISYWIANGTYAGEAVAPKDSMEAPRVVFTKEENEKKASIMNTLDTYVKEMIIKFIKGEMSFNEWENFQSALKKMGDYETIVKMHNDKL